VSALLAATVTQIGTLAPVGIENIRTLAVLDRDILLMALHLRLFGDRIQATIRCPNAGCGKLIDIDFCLSDLPIPERYDVAPQYVFAADGKSITYRLPTGRDQEAAAALARNDADKAAQIILQRCVDHLDAFSPEQVAALRQEMDRRDPQIETEFDTLCPECSSRYEIHFDVQDFLLREITATRMQLYRQVHTLAWYYHWSEAEIMALPYLKRRIYINLLSDLISEAERIPA
jgi:hypothetical protein